MAHNYYHCGGVGTDQGFTGPIFWEHYWTMTLGYKLSADLPERKMARLRRKIERRVCEMGDVAQDFFEKEYSQAPPATFEIHPDLLFAGNYFGFAIGIQGPVIELPPFPVYSDFLMTYSFPSFFVGHEKASYLDTVLSIIRYEAYLDVYKFTGGEIHLASAPYTPLEVEVED